MNSYTASVSTSWRGPRTCGDRILFVLMDKEGGSEVSRYSIAENEVIVAYGKRSRSMRRPSSVSAKRCTFGCFAEASASASVPAAITRARRTFPKRTAATIEAVAIIPSAQYQSALFSWKSYSLPCHSNCAPRAIYGNYNPTQRSVAGERAPLVRERAREGGITNRLTSREP